MIICLDTSAVNALHDDPDREALVAGLLAGGQFYVSAYNVLEAAATKDEKRRRSLVRLLEKLAKRKRPLNAANTIIRGLADAHAAGKSTLTVNADEDLEGVWQAMLRADEIDDAARIEAAEWAAERTAEFEATVSRARPLFQELFKRRPEERPPTAAETIRRYFKHKEQVFEQLIAPIYLRQTGKTLDRDGFEELLEEPAWILYFGTYVYALHHRAMPEQGYSARWHADAIDLQQSVYLRFCDWFVTEDGPQYRALRLMNRFNTDRRVEVVRYATFRRRFLVSV